MYKIYGFGPTRSLRAKWALQEAGFQFSFEDAREILKTEAFKRLHPLGKMPVLVHDGKVIFESVAITNYIGAQTKNSVLLPVDGSYERSQYDQWSAYALAELEAWVWSSAKHSFLLPEDQRVPQVIEGNSREFIVAAKVVNDVLAERTYILGDNFSFADINLAYALNWGRCFGLTGDFANINRYLDLLSARSACPLNEQTEFFANLRD